MKKQFIFKLSLKQQLLILFLYEIFVCIFLLLINANALLFISITWLIPSLFILLILKRAVIKIVGSSLIYGVIGTIIIDSLGHISNSWEYWKNPNFASSGIYLSKIPIESFLWGILFFLFYLCVYVYFFDRIRSYKFNRNERFLWGVVTLVAFIIYNCLKYNLLFSVPFFYLQFEIVTIIISIIILRKKRGLMQNVLEFSLISFIIGNIIEIFSLKLHLWTFPGTQYVYVLNIFSNTLPLEEVLWWFFVPCCIALLNELFSNFKNK